MCVTHSDPLAPYVCVCVYLYVLCDLKPPGIIDQTAVDGGYGVCVCKCVFVCVCHRLGVGGGGLLTPVGIDCVSHCESVCSHQPGIMGILFISRPIGW